jgi:hypothetical protein
MNRITLIRSVWKKYNQPMPVIDIGCGHCMIFDFDYVRFDKAKIMHDSLTTANVFGDFHDMNMFQDNHFGFINYNKESKMKLLLVCGGLLLGDNFHLLPYINKYKEEGYNDITWVTGTYSKVGSSFIASRPNSGIIKLIHLEDGFPKGIRDREKFIETFNKHKNNLQLESFDKEILDPYATFEWQHEIKPDMDKYNLDFEWGIERKNKDYICVQYSSVHEWKKIPALKEVNYPLPIKSLGLPGEEIIPGSEDCRGKSLEEVAKLILESKLYVGIHSSLTCLNFYLNKPAIVCGFSRRLFQFSRFRKNMIDLIQPSSTQIEESILKLLEEQK